MFKRLEQKFCEEPSLKQKCGDYNDELEIHGFANASESAYAACSLLKKSVRRGLR